MSQTWQFTFTVTTEGSSKDDALAKARDLIAERLEPSHAKQVQQGGSK